MGVYLNWPDTIKKGPKMEAIGIEMTLEEARVCKEDQKMYLEPEAGGHEFILVVLVDNGPFDAALVVTSPREWEDMVEYELKMPLARQRPQRFFFVSMDELFASGGHMG